MNVFFMVNHAYESGIYYKKKKKVADSLQEALQN
jgi:hypothetical protein